MVMPWYPLNRIPKYPPALAIMVRRFQYVRRSRIVLGPTPYAVRISRYLPRSRASYAFWRPKKTSKRTTSLMAISDWISLASRVDVPVPGLPGTRAEKSEY